MVLNLHALDLLLLDLELELDLHLGKKVDILMFTQWL
jgi:hypothetical protein